MQKCEQILVKLWVLPTPPVMSIRGPKTSAGKPVNRTNSLGSAKVDCHTCLQLRSLCDRQRPRCGTCIKNRRQCGGFTTTLVWKDLKGSRKSRGPSTDESNDDDDSTNDRPEMRKGGVQQFKFVKPRQRAKRKSRTQREGTSRFLLSLDRDSALSCPSPVATDSNAFTGSAPSDLVAVSSLENSPIDQDPRTYEHGGSNPLSGHISLPPILTKMPTDSLFTSEVLVQTTWARSPCFGPDPDFVLANTELVSSDHLDDLEPFSLDLAELSPMTNSNDTDRLADTSINSDPDLTTGTGGNLVRHFSLSPPIRYLDIAQKYDPIMTRCKSLITPTVSPTPYSSD